MPAHPRQRTEFSRLVGFVIRRRRMDKGISQTALAEAAGAQRYDSLMRIEKRGTSSVEVIRRYALALGTTATAIVAEAEERLTRKLERDAALRAAGLRPSHVPDDPPFGAGGL